MALEDWATRTAGATVLSATRLTSEADLGANGHPIAGGADNWGWGNLYGLPAYPPIIDESMSCEGVAGALMFSLPNGSNASCGQWGRRFKNANASTVGRNQSVFVQGRVRWNQVLYSTIYYSNAATQERQGGIKFFDIARTDAGTSDDVKVVVNTYYQRRILVAYKGPNSQNFGLYPNVGGSDFDLQNGLGATCLYSAAAGAPANQLTISGCTHMVPDEWVTLQCGLELAGNSTTAPYNDGNWVDGRYRLWLARDGATSTLLIDWKSGVTGYTPFYLPAGQTFGMLYLFPYMTGKDPSQVTDFGKAWYRDWIVATAQIADPVASTQTTPSPQNNTGRRSRIRMP